MSALQTIDLTLLAWIYDWRHPALSAGMGIVTWLGSLAVLLPLALLIGWHLDARRDWRHRVFLGTAIIGAAVIAHVLKWAIDRDRPDLFPSLVAMPADSSFPSAHALQVTAFVAAWLISSGGWRSVGQVVAGLMLVAAVCFSRLYLQVHFPTDVLIGVLGGLLWVWILHRLPVWRRV